MQQQQQKQSLTTATPAAKFIPSNRNNHLHLSEL
jgi:hypothetical protein